MRKLKGRVLLIPDSHQNLWFIRKALADYVDNVDHVVFMGDYFDTHFEINNITHFGMKHTIQYLMDTSKSLGDKATWLIGNHDATYFGNWNPDYTKSISNVNYYCSGWSGSKQKEFNKHVDPEWMFNTELAVQANEFTIVHAGFHYHQFKPMMSEQENVEDMVKRWNEDKKDFRFTHGHWIYNVGTIRGGRDPVGGPLWLDWTNEFTPVDNLNQIVGHTSKFQDEPRTMEGQNSVNYCIDSMQHAVMILDEDKPPEFIKFDTDELKSRIK
jgi:predicted phosphodiesterase